MLPYLLTHLPFYILILTGVTGVMGLGILRFNLPRFRNSPAQIRPYAYFFTNRIRCNLFTHTFTTSGNRFPYSFGNIHGLLFMVVWQCSERWFEEVWQYSWLLFMDVWHYFVGPFEEVWQCSSEPISMPVANLSETSSSNIAKTFRTSSSTIAKTFKTSSHAIANLPELPTA